MDIASLFIPNAFAVDVFGVDLSVPVLIGIGIVVILIALLIISSVRSGKSKKVEDLDKREQYGDFHGLLTAEDFDYEADDPTLEMYRRQWIKADPGVDKDNALLLYLALKQLNKEQDEAQEEWTQEQCEARMDELIEELSEKTGLKFIEPDAFAEGDDTPAQESEGIAPEESDNAPEA